MIYLKLEVNIHHEDVNNQHLTNQTIILDSGIIHQWQRRSTGSPEIVYSRLRLAPHWGYALQLIVILLPQSTPVDGILNFASQTWNICSLYNCAGSTEDKMPIETKAAIKMYPFEETSCLQQYFFLENFLTSNYMGLLLTSCLQCISLAWKPSNVHCFLIAKAVKP